MERPSVKERQVTVEVGVLWIKVKLVTRKKPKWSLKTALDTLCKFVFLFNPAVYRGAIPAGGLVSNLSMNSIVTRFYSRPLTTRT